MPRCSSETAGWDAAVGAPDAAAGAAFGACAVAALDPAEAAPSSGEKGTARPPPPPVSTYGDLPYAEARLSLPPAIACADAHITARARSIFGRQIFGGFSLRDGCCDVS